MGKVNYERLLKLNASLSIENLNLYKSIIYIKCSATKRLQTKTLKKNLYSY